MLTTPKYVGEPSVESLASGLATLGRYGDEYMVHAAEGETVIPKEILDSNPQLKRDLFRQMMMMGIRDPNRYVVGSSFNSINPVTGQPEFFFKKIFKVFKKALPIIATVAGNYIAPGIGGVIASALVTKLQGGSWGDALKAGAMSYAGSALMGGIGGAYNAPTGGGWGGFTSGLQQGLTAPFTAAGNLFSGGPLDPLQQGIFGSAKALAGKGLFGMPKYNPQAGMPFVAGTAGAGAAGAGTAGTAGSWQGGAGGQDTFVEGAAAGDATAAAYSPNTITSGHIPDVAVPQAGGVEFDPMDGMGPGEADVIGDPRVNIPGKPEKSFFGDVSDRVFNALDPSPEAALAAQEKALAADIARRNTLRGVPMSKEEELIFRVNWAENHPAPGLLQRYAPLLGAGAVGIGGIAAATGAFDFEEEEEEFRNKNFGAASEEMTAYNEWKRLPNKNSPQAQSLYFKWHGQPNRTRSQFEFLTGGKSSRPDWRFLPELPGKYDMGGEVIGPGTGTSDSIPARLSDGEFVMTADAVRNAGGGDRNLGAARMYDMMRRFEGGTA